MKTYHKNPRRIDREDFDRLRNSLEELGDLGGVVHNIRTDEIVGGNQRAKVFDINRCEIVITEEYEVPDSQGTIAIGYIVWDEKKYSYRRVYWDEVQAEKANILANDISGTWDYAILGRNFDVEKLELWGMSSDDLDKVNVELFGDGGNDDVTEKDISDAEESVNDMSKNESETIEIPCPYCHEVIMVRKSDFIRE